MRVCNEPGCPVLAVDGRHCRAHRREAQQRKREQRSEAGLRAQAWYRSKRWAERRRRQLAEHPYCQCEEHRGQRVPADIADHDPPHGGNEHAFFHGPLISLAKRCHDSWKQRREKGRHPLHENARVVGRRAGAQKTSRTG